MIVGITTRLSPFFYGEIQEQRDALAHDWLMFLSKFKVIPVLIPNALKDPVEYVERLGVTRLLLSGGDSLGQLSHETQHIEIGSTATSSREALFSMPTRRDLTETKLLEWALQKAVPVLGVCRGLQMINTYFGGGLTRSLHQCVLNEFHLSHLHTIYLLREPFAGQKIIVNSYHDQGVLCTQLAPSLEVLAETPNGVIEALRHQRKPILAMQWHPERHSPSSDIDYIFLQEWLSGK